jgi:thioredoxin reductase (NADPH)
MAASASTDVIIIGAGPVGLFAVFQLGLVQLKAHVVDILDKPGGQCAAPRQTTVRKMRELESQGLVKFELGQPSALKGSNGMLNAVVLKRADGSTAEIAADVLLPLFGLTMKLGPIADFGLNLNENLIPVDTERFEKHQGPLRHRRHQYLSRQAEADPVRLPRGRAHGASSTRICAS